MFKTALTAILLTLLAVSVSAQTSVVVSTQLGASNLAGHQQAAWAQRTSVGIEKQLWERWNVSASAGYYNPGNKRSIGFTTLGHDLARYTEFIRVHLVDFEAAFGFQLSKRFRVSMGAYSGYQFASQKRHRWVFTNNGEETDRTNNKDDLTNLFEKVDFGIRPSVSFAINDVLRIRGTFSQGLQRMNLEQTQGNDYRTQAILLGLDWKIIQM